MSTSYHGLDGAIGPPKTADYSGKAAVPPGTKPYVKTFGRLSITGGIIKHDRSYAGKVELEPLVEGGVQSEPPTVVGVITKTAFKTISGGVQVAPPVVNGSITLIGKTITGGVQSQAPVLTGTVDVYPIAGWSLVTFTVDHAGLDPDSPYTDAAYSSLEIGDKSHFETLTTPSGSTMTMDSLGEFTISPPSTVIETFDHQIYDASDGTFGAVGTITVTPTPADEVLSGGVQSQAPVLSGSLNNFAVHTMSGGVQAGLSVLFGIVTNSPGGDLQLLTGGVQAQSSTVSGLLENVITMSGGVQAQTPVLTGSLRKISILSGAVQSQSSTVSGFVQGGLILQPANLADVPKRTSKKRRLNRKIKVRSLKR